MATPVPPWKPATPHGRWGAAADGLDVLPFRGLRFSPERVDLAAVTSPPYDVVDAEGARRLESLEPHNIVRLILPRSDDGGPAGRYDRAAQTLDRWRSDGTLLSDASPCFYVYEQDDGASHQRGILAAVALSPPEQRIILPHEDVMPGPVADRLALMTATRANLEPILLIHDGEEQSGAAVEAVITMARAEPPEVDLRTAEGVRHRIWPVDRRADVVTVRDAMQRRRALIADGHHRYAAYRALQRRHHDAGDGEGPWDRGLALLVDSSRYPLDLRAIHRAVAGLSYEHAVARLDGLFTVTPIDVDEASILDVLPTPEAGGQTFGLVSGGHPQAALLTVVDPPAVQRRVADRLPETASPTYRSLAATILHVLLLDDLWEVAEDRVSYHHDAGSALRAARRQHGVAVLLSPADLRDVLTVADEGGRMPRKSTSFGPKPRTGVVLRPLDLH